MYDNPRVHRAIKMLIKANLQANFQLRTTLKTGKDVPKYRSHLKKNALKRARRKVSIKKENYEIVLPDLPHVTMPVLQAKLGTVLNSQNKFYYKPGENEENELDLIKALARGEDYIFDNDCKPDFLTVSTPKIIVLEWMMQKLVPYCPSGMEWKFVLFEEDNAFIVFQRDYMGPGGGEGFGLAQIENLRKSDIKLYWLFVKLFCILHDVCDIRFWWEVEDNSYQLGYAIEMQMDCEEDYEDKSPDKRKRRSYIHRSQNRYYRWGGGRLKRFYESHFGKYSITELKRDVEKFKIKRKYQQIAIDWINNGILLAETGESIESFVNPFANEEDIMPIDIFHQCCFWYTCSNKDWIWNTFDNAINESVQAGGEILSPTESFRIHNLKNIPNRSIFPEVLCIVFQYAESTLRKIIKDAARHRYSKRSI